LFDYALNSTGAVNKHIQYMGVLQSLVLESRYTNQPSIDEIYTYVRV